MRKRTGPGGPPGLQNRLSPALSGRAEFDSQALPPFDSPAMRSAQARSWQAARMALSERRESKGYSANPNLYSASLIHSLPAKRMSARERSQRAGSDGS